MPFYFVLISLLFCAGIVGYYLTKIISDVKISKANEQAKIVLADAKKQAKINYEKVLSKQNKKTKKYQIEQNTELSDQEQETEIRGERLNKRSNNIIQSEHRIDQLDIQIKQKEMDLQELADIVDEKFHKKDQLLDQRISMLEDKSQINHDHAVQQVLNDTKHHLEIERAKTVKNERDEQVLDANKKGTELLDIAIQNGPIDVPKDHIERSVIIPDVFTRSKISGKDDQNLRLLESLCGVDLIFDPEYPDTLIINTNDPLRRETTKLAIKNLMVDQQINPGIIENEVNDANDNIISGLRKTGEETVSNLRLGWIHPDLIKLIGRLKYRTSYGQNVLAHSIEVAQIMAVFAAEIGLDVTLAKRAGLLHDIGKSIDRDMEGTHVEVGVQLTKTFEEDPIIINSIQSHHGDVKPESKIAILVAAADSISGARTGARSESVEEYINRLKGLEKIANQVDGVKDSYAIQAGREIRIVVDPQKVNDDQSNQLTEKVKNQIEDELTYPGKITVTTIRRLQAIQYVGGKPKNKKQAG
ncbi:ribonuclease Y [Lactobacillus sp. S2-2]|uniref:ribonuclease Y n=1 Tax=Lactobacillus sp. S2-2 TaxID=2692917 RepID=UPI001F024E35|nr:ribonuclease Y [Lactobacillus sp. S2-2]MCF6515271.1 ribonuclease Y [Lactobacillus sp. S2-2]